MTEAMQLNYQNAVDEYDEEMVNLSISLFINETYKELKVKMPEAYHKKDYQSIKAIAHKFKTTSKYMGADEFAAICGKIQKSVDEGSTTQIDQLYQTFMTKLEVLFEVCSKQNEIIQKTIEEGEVEKEIDDYAIKEEENEDDSVKPNSEDKDKKKTAEFILQIVEGSQKPSFQKSKSVYDITFTGEKKAEKTNQIQIRYAKAIQTFDAEIIDVIIQKFLMEEYKVIKANLLMAFNKKDTKAILSQLHTMKLKAKYMCAEEFADNILKLENCIRDSNADLRQLEALFPEFMENMELLYREVQDCYEKNHQEELLNDSITPTTPSFNKEFLFNNKNYFDQKSSPIDSSPFTLKKQGSSKAGLISNNAKLREFDQFSNQNIMSSNKKRIFDIDLSLLKTTDSDVNNTFDADILALLSKFKDAIENGLQKNLIECLNKLKELIARYKFNLLTPHCDEWIQLIQSSKDFRVLNVSYEDICLVLNQMKAIMREKKELNCSKTPGNLSTKKMINDSPSCSTVARNEDNILTEMKPLPMNYFYCSSYSPEELEEQINQITHHEEKKEKGGFMKHLSKPIKANMPFALSVYPFKEETISCLIV